MQNQALLSRSGAPGLLFDGSIYVKVHASVLMKEAVGMKTGWQPSFGVSSMQTIRRDSAPKVVSESRSPMDAIMFGRRTSRRKITGWGFLAILLAYLTLNREVPFVGANGSQGDSEAGKGATDMQSAAADVVSAEKEAVALKAQLVKLTSGLTQDEKAAYGKIQAIVQLQDPPIIDEYKKLLFGLEMVKGVRRTFDSSGNALPTNSRAATVQLFNAIINNDTAMFYEALTRPLGFGPGVAGQVYDPAVPGITPRDGVTYIFQQYGPYPLALLLAIPDSVVKGASVGDDLHAAQGLANYLNGDGSRSEMLGAMTPISSGVSHLQIFFESFVGDKAKLPGYDTRYPATGAPITRRDANGIVVDETVAVQLTGP